MQFPQLQLSVHPTYAAVKIGPICSRNPSRRKNSLSQGMGRWYEDDRRCLRLRTGMTSGDERQVVLDLNKHNHSARTYYEEIQRFFIIAWVVWDGLHHHLRTTLTMVFPPAKGLKSPAQL